MIEVKIVMLSGEKYEYQTDDPDVESKYFERYSNGELFTIVMKKVVYNTNSHNLITEKRMYIDTKRIDYATFTSTKTVRED